MGRTHIFASAASYAFGAVTVLCRFHSHGTDLLTGFTSSTSVQIQVHLIKTESVKDTVKRSQGT